LHHCGLLSSAERQRSAAGEAGPLKRFVRLLASKPVPRAPAGVSYSHDLNSTGRFAEDDEERESV
jgi:hypothetical protein